MANTSTRPGYATLKKMKKMKEGDGFFPPKPKEFAAIPAPPNTEWVPIGNLISDSANPRKHKLKNIEAIKASLKRFGQIDPVIVTTDKVVRAGNGRLQAAKELGWKYILVQWAPGLKGAEATAFAIAHNRTAELADWDIETLEANLQGLKEEGWSNEDFTQIGFDDRDFKDLDLFKDEPMRAPIIKDPIEVPVSPEDSKPTKRHARCPVCKGDLMCPQCVQKSPPQVSEQEKPQELKKS